MGGWSAHPGVLRVRVGKRLSTRVPSMGIRVHGTENNLHRRYLKAAVIVEVYLE